MGSPNSRRARFATRGVQFVRRSGRGMKRNTEIGLNPRPSSADGAHLAAHMRRLARRQVVIRGLVAGRAEENLRDLRIRALFRAEALWASRPEQVHTAVFKTRNLGNFQARWQRATLLLSIADSVTCEQ